MVTQTARGLKTVVTNKISNSRSVCLRNLVCCQKSMMACQVLMSCMLWKWTSSNKYSGTLKQYLFATYLHKLKRFHPSNAEWEVPQTVSEKQIFAAAVFKVGKFRKAKSKKSHWKVEQFLSPWSTRRATQLRAETLLFSSPAMLVEFSPAKEKFIEIK